MDGAILGIGRAVGKAILFGEHAVVYDRPALAVPVTQVWAEATVEPAARGAGLTIHAINLGEEIALRAAASDHPLAAAVRLALAHLGLAEPDWRVIVRSTIPVASGLGSGAAVSAAIVRAVLAAANQRISQAVHGENAARHAPYALTPADISSLVYEVEKLHHGTPSGIDNTVIAYEQPVYFVRGLPPEPFTIGWPFTLAIADTGIRSPTRIAVGDVRAGWQAQPARFEALFDAIATVVQAARRAITAGETEKLGPLMDENHALLQEIGVSCPELDALVVAARSAGALGAKLSGAGRGGNMIALVTPATAAAVTAALRGAGATRVIVTEVSQT
ncbi:MAG: mevalonate kinase [Anaerolineae bacterium]